MQNATTTTPTTTTTTTNYHLAVVLLRSLELNCGHHANEMQMKNLYSSCDDESNNIVIQTGDVPSLYRIPISVPYDSFWTPFCRKSKFFNLLLLLVLLLLLLLRLAVTSLKVCIINCIFASGFGLP